MRSHLESILTAAVLGLQIAVILLCFGAANSLASPYRLLRCLPAVLYETGVAVTVALSFTPELVETVSAVRQARRLRGIPSTGCVACVASPFRSWRVRSTARCSWPPAWTPGATGGATRRPIRSRVLAVGATAVGLLLVAVGLYGVIDAGSLFGLGLPILAVAVVLCAVGLAVAGRRMQRTRYRPDRWRGPEWDLDVRAWSP